MGIANLQATKYLAIITEALFVGNIKGAKVFRVEQVEFCPYAPPSVLAVSQSKRTDDQYIDMYQEVIRSQSLYFSYDYDLTTNTISTASISTRTNSPTERETALGWSCTCTKLTPAGKVFSIRVVAV